MLASCKLPLLMPVTVTRELRQIPTYGLGEPERNPLFFEKRVYQGSSGRVYPLPFVDKVLQDEPPRPMTYQAIRLENEWVRLVLLPEIGGRILLGQDKANDDYDFFYRQDVIKPALVGLAGPWISGGVEFNWPQHHRPGTFMPADVRIEEETDGAVTVWMSEHDPLQRMKGMHGIRLRPESARIELRGRLYNRTPLTQTFLWWANVAARVHDQYQSFFPDDVHYVADHAVRAMSSFPHAENLYYGIDYAARPGANDLTWYRHIPVPTSYMVCETAYGFFGGYDHTARGGFVHYADPAISPGKKQWTWGNAPFGWAWDRELTDENGPYVELMAGVFTDNQPDFSYLRPFETRTFSQSWWPYQQLGPVQQANEDLALRLVVAQDRSLDFGLAASSRFPDLQVELRHGGRLIESARVSVAPGQPWRGKALQFAGENASELLAEIRDAAGRLLLSYQPADRESLERTRSLATEPPAPGPDVSTDELYFIGEHLELYRHPTRAPEPYWEEAIRRDPGDYRSQLALGRRKLSRGLREEARHHLEAAVRRATERHPNPESGEAHYYLGLNYFQLETFDAAQKAFAKACWDGAWQSAGSYWLALIAARSGDEVTALSHASAAHEADPDHSKAGVVGAILLRRSGRKGEAAKLLTQLMAKDPLDHWAAFEQSMLHEAPALPVECRNDAQTILDLVFDYLEGNFLEEALTLIQLHHAHDTTPAPVPNPLARTSITHYAEARILAGLGRCHECQTILDRTSRLSPDYLFPSRHAEEQLLEWVLRASPHDANAAYALGNLLYDKGRKLEAIRRWEQSRLACPNNAVVHRNLAIAAWNVRRDPEAARASYREALRCDPADARLVAEYDQLCEKLEDPAEDRLRFLESHLPQVLSRDDASLALATLLNDTGQSARTLELLTNRTFHPWEGGEGKVLRQFTRAHLLLGYHALESGDALTALHHFEAALETPDSLGEKYHPLQAKADVLLARGRALRALGREGEAVECFEAAAAESGDFEQMAVTTFSELSIHRAEALAALGRREEATRLREAIRQYTEDEMQKPSTIDYFATSLPNLLVFEEDLALTRQKTMERLRELATETQ